MRYFWIQNLRIYAFLIFSSSLGLKQVVTDLSILVQDVLYCLYNVFVWIYVFSYLVLPV